MKSTSKASMVRKKAKKGTNTPKRKLNRRGVPVFEWRPMKAKSCKKWKELEERHLGENDSVFSDTFNFRGLEFSLELFPQGDCKAEKNKASLFLYIDRDSWRNSPFSKMTLQWTITVKDTAKDSKQLRHITRTKDFESTGDGVDNWGCSDEFDYHAEIDPIIIVSDLMIQKSARKKRRFEEAAAMVPIDESMFEAEGLPPECIATLKCDDGEVKVSRFMMHARGGQLGKLLTHGRSKEDRSLTMDLEPHLNLGAVKLETLRVLRNYIMNTCSDMAQHSCTTLCQLYEFGRMYLIPHLQTAVLGILKDKIMMTGDPVSIGQVMRAAVKGGHRKMTLMVMEQFQKNAGNEALFEEVTEAMYANDG